MLDFVTKQFDTQGFPPRWLCGSGWATDPSLGWLHVLSDCAIFGAYTAIPLVIAYFVLRRRDVPFPKIFWLFVIFIFACGTTHLIEAIIFWHPDLSLRRFGEVHHRRRLLVHSRGLGVRHSQSTAPARAGQTQQRTDARNRRAPPNRIGLAHQRAAPPRQRGTPSTGRASRPHGKLAMESSRQRGHLLGRISKPFAADARSSSAALWSKCSADVHPDDREHLIARALRGRQRARTISYRISSRASQR